MVYKCLVQCLLTTKKQILGQFLKSFLQLLKVVAITLIELSAALNSERSAVASHGA